MTHGRLGLSLGLAGRTAVAQGIYRDRRPPVARFVRGGAGPCRGVLVLTGHPPTGTKGPVVGGVTAAVGSPSTSFLGVCTYSFQPGVVAMIKDTAHRAWRIAITVGPLAAIALSLAAGMKWR